MIVKEIPHVPSIEVLIFSILHGLSSAVDIACVLFRTQSVSMVQNQNTRKIYHKQMKDGVCRPKVL